MRIKCIFLIALLIICKKSNANDFLDFIDGVFSFQTNEQENIWNLQKSPEVSIEDFFNQKISELIAAGKYFKYSKQLSERCYIVQYESEKIVIKILRDKQLDLGNNFPSKAISKKDILDQLEFSIKKIDNFWSLELKNFNDYIDVKKYKNEVLENNSQNFSLISAYNWKEKILIDKEIMNGNGINYSGQVFNRSQSLNHFRFNNQPCDLYSEITASTIIPYDGGTRAKIFTIDKLWNRIVWFDRDKFNPNGLIPQFSHTNPMGYYSLAFPTDITYGSTIVTNNNLNECNFTGKDSTINLIIAELANNRISKVDYRIRTYMSNCGLQQLNKEYNVLDNTFTVIKSNCNFPYSLGLHKGSDNFNINDDLIWYSEGNWNTKRLNCIYFNSGNDVPNQSIAALDFGRGLEAIHPSRISIYKSPDGLKNVLCFVDEQRNSLVFLKLSLSGTIDLSPGNYFIDEVRFGNEQKLQSAILTANDNGLEGVTVWAVTNAPGGCGPICGNIHTLKINYLINTPINVEYLASYWKGANSQSSFVNLNNLHAQNGFLDIFTMEKWDNNYGLRRYKPGLDIIADNYTGFCSNTSNMKITLRITNPCKIQLDNAQYKSSNQGSNWVTMPTTLVNGIPNSNLQYLQSGTVTLNIVVPNVPYVMDTPNPEVKITFRICPQDEFMTSSVYKIEKVYITSVINCNQIGGCPFVFVNNGSDFVQDNNILHRSEFDENIGNDIEDKYMLRVTPVFSQSDSTCEIKIKELNNDISYFDKFSLVAIDHPAGTSLGITEENNYVLYFPQITNSPDHAEHEGEDVTSELSYDSNYTKTVSGDEEDYVSATYEEKNYGFMKFNYKMKEVLRNSMKKLINGVENGIVKNYNLNKGKRKSGNISDLQLFDSVAIILDPSQSDIIINPGPPIKKPAGIIYAVDNLDPENPTVEQFAKRQNTSPVIITIGKNANIDSIYSVWNSEFKISYLSVTPVYYGGYVESALELVEATDSVSGNVLISLLNSDSIYSVMDSTTNITLKFKNNIGNVEPGFIRDYILVTNGRYENLLSQQANRNAITSGETNITGIPDEYKLHQNYPNPFNPVTKIKYDLPKDGIVSIKIYNILGKEIFSIKEFKEAGFHSIQFSALSGGMNLSSGIYFYRISAGSFVQTKRMVLLK